MPYRGKVSRRDPGHVFSRAPQANIPRSSFNRSHGVKTTFDAGYLVPILVDEMLPGDTFNVKLHAFVRMSTPLFPIMDNLYLETFYFAVPNRLLWEHWEEFNGARTGPADTTSSDQYTIPIFDGVTVAEGSLGDYFGLPTQIAGIDFNSLPFRAYNLIYNEWFKDENLQDDVVVDFDDGPDTLTDYVLRRRGKRRDYFTSCLPWPQKLFGAGGTATSTSLPLGTTAPVISTTNSIDLYSRQSANGGTLNWATTGANPTLRTSNSGVTGESLYPSPNDGDAVAWLEADLSSATAATINDIRLAFQTQKLYERDARGGTRYTEIIRLILAELKSFLIDLELPMGQQGASVIAA